MHLLATEDCCCCEDSLLGLLIRYVLFYRLESGCDCDLLSNPWPKMRKRRHRLRREGHRPEILLSASDGLVWICLGVRGGASRSRAKTSWPVGFAIEAKRMVGEG